MTSFEGNLSNWKKYESFFNPLNMTIPDLNLFIFARNADFLDASKSNNKQIMAFAGNVERLLVHLTTNNNTINGANLTMRKSLTNTGLVDADLDGIELTLDQATGTFLEDNLGVPFLADRALAVKYNQGNSDIVIKGASMGVSYS